MLGEEWLVARRFNEKPTNILNDDTKECGYYIYCKKDSLPENFKKNGYTECKVGETYTIYNDKSKRPSTVEEISEVIEDKGFFFYESAERIIAEVARVEFQDLYDIYKVKIVGLTLRNHYAEEILVTGKLYWTECN